MVDLEPRTPALTLTPVFDLGRGLGGAMCVAIHIHPLRCARVTCESRIGTQHVLKVDPFWNSTQFAVVICCDV